MPASSSCTLLLTVSALCQGLLTLPQPVTISTLLGARPVTSALWATLNVAPRSLSPLLLSLSLPLLQDLTLARRSWIHHTMAACAAYVSVRQRTSAYVSIREHTSARCPWTTSSPPAQQRQRGEGSEERGARSEERGERREPAEVD
jgi:hypothetical protein